MSRRPIILWLAAGLMAALVASGAARAASPAATAVEPVAGGLWRSGGPLDDNGQPIPITAVAASPNYDRDSTLFAAGHGRGYGSLYRSTDGGGRWAEIFYPAPPNPYSGGWFAQVAAAKAPAGPAHIVFASYNGNLSPGSQPIGQPTGQPSGQPIGQPIGQSATAPLAPYGALYRSTDRGQSWELALARMQIGPFALSPAFASDQILFVMVEGRLNRSSNGGASWQPLPFPTAAHPLDVFELAISPHFAADRTLFAGGYGPTQRSTDAGLSWQPLPGYNPSHALAVSPAFHLDRSLWSAYRLIEGIGDGTPEAGVIRSGDGGDSWQLAGEGLPGAYEPFPASLAVSPDFANDRSLFTALRGQFLGWDQHSLFRSYNGGESWIDLGPAPGNPNAFDLAVTHTLVEGVVAHLATERGVWEYGGGCEERLVNGGFETDAAWVFPNTPHPAGYSLALAHSGHRSLRAGIIAGPDLRSYSSARQTLAIPAGIASATLSLWQHPLSQESGPALPPPDLETMGESALDAGLSGDAQYILLLDEDGDLLRTLAWEKSNAALWQLLSFDLSAYAGRTVQLHIGAFNDGNGQKTALFADDVSLLICRTAAPAVRAYLPMLLRSSPPLPTPTPSPTPTPAPPACYDGLHNGDFETNDAWLIKDNPVPAGYVAAPVHGGARAMRTGIASGGANLRSYSPIEQTITIPAGASTARLRFWRYRLWGDGTAAPPGPLALPAAEAELPNAALDTDFFYVLAIRANGSLVWLLVERANDPAWRQAEIDLHSLAGQTVRLQFGTYNTGAGGRSATYLDDAHLSICPPAGALVLPSGWAQRVVGRPESSTVYADVSGALYRSNDAGVSWAPSGTIPPAHALAGNGPEMLFAGQGYPCFMGGPPTPFWRSSDGGASWQLLAAGENLKPLAAHPARPWVYAAGCDGPYRSTDNGQSWRHQPDPLFPTYGIYHLAPLGPDWMTVWASGISEGGGGVALLSRDGGENWQRTTPLDPDWGWIGGLQASRFMAERIRVGQVYGFYESLDDGRHWFSHSVGLEDVIEPGPAGRSYGLFAIAESPLSPDGFGRRLYLGSVRGLYTRDPGRLDWRKLSPQPFDAWAVRELLLLDAAPARLFVGSERGVFVLGP